jgi:hypothetical protein
MTARREEPTMDDMYEREDEYGEGEFCEDRERPFCPECGGECCCEEFADPGGTSALRAASPSNPRNLPCPTCGEPDRLTPKDKALGYQCDACADRAERGMDY